MKNDKVFICTKCGTPFREEASGNCHSCYLGEIKGYDKSGAVIANILDRVGYNVLVFSIPNDTDVDRKTEIKIADVRDFTNFETLEGFTYDTVSQPIDTYNNKRFVVELHKQYRIDMPHLEFAFELARDKVRLIEWVYSLPLVKDLIRS